MNTISKGGLRNLRLESIYHSMETSFGAVRAKIISGHQATDSDLDAVVDFTAAQIVRTPKFRASWQISTDEDHAEKLARIADADTRLAMENTLATIWANRFQALCLLAYPQILQLLRQMRVRLFKASEPRIFITSDAPCCVIEYADFTGSVLECLASPTVNVLIPLSPNVVALLDRSDQPHEMTQIFPGHPSVNRINSMIWRGAMDDIVLPNDIVRTEWISGQFSEEANRYIVL